MGWRRACRIRAICRGLLRGVGGLVELEPFVGVCWWDGGGLVELETFVGVCWGV